MNSRSTNEYFMKKISLLLGFLLFFHVMPLQAQSSAKAELIQLLHEFMEGASANDREVHDRFWAEDLIYTSSSGERFGKEQIMAGFNDSEEGAREPATTYSAEDIQIQVYGKMAVVAFRLVGKTETEEGIQTARYLNSGTFIKRDGDWKAVNWQATKMN